MSAKTVLEYTLILSIVLLVLLQADDFNALAGRVSAFFTSVVSGLQTGLEG